MSDLIAIVYPTEERAGAVVNSVREMQDAHLVDCYVMKDARGRAGQWCWAARSA